MNWEFKLIENVKTNYGSELEIEDLYNFINEQIENPFLWIEENLINEDWYNNFSTNNEEINYGIQ